MATNDSSMYIYLVVVTDEVRCVQEEKTRDKAVSLLLRRGADVNLRDDVGRTACAYACQLRCNDVVRILVKNNVNPDIADNNGQSLVSSPPPPFCSNFTAALARLYAYRISYIRLVLTNLSFEEHLHACSAECPVWKCYNLLCFVSRGP